MSNNPSAAKIWEMLSQQERQRLSEVLARMAAKYLKAQIRLSKEQEGQNGLSTRCRQN